MIAGTQTWADEPKPTSKATMREYNIASLDDFLRVPRDRQAACLAEFAPLLDMVRDHPRSFGAVVALDRFTWRDGNGAVHDELIVHDHRWWQAALGLGVPFLLGCAIGWLVMR